MDALQLEMLESKMRAAIYPGTTVSEVVDAVLEGIVNPKPYTYTYVSDYTLCEYKSTVVPTRGKWKGKVKNGTDK